MRDVACSGFSRCCPRTFVTPRLQARLLDGQDAELFAACYGDAATMRHVGPTLDSAATARAFAAALRQLRSDPPAAFYWRLDTAAGAVGLLSLVPDVNRRRAETGVLLCAARGQGVAREALSMLLALRDARTALPRAAVLMAPWTDLTVSSPSYRRLRKFDPIITQEKLREAGLMYAGSRNPADPMLSPLFADLGGLPPMLIHAGEDEVMVDDSRRLAERARAAGIDVSCKIFPGMWHVFHASGIEIPEARQAIDEIGAYVRALFVE